MFKLFAYMAAITMLSATGERPAKSCELTVYYLPLELEFFVPPTPEHIREYGEVIADKQFVHLCGITVCNEMRDGGTSDNGRLRILVEDSSTGKVYFLTADGTVVFEGREYKVDGTDFEMAIDEIKTNLPKGR